MIDRDREWAAARVLDLATKCAPDVMGSSNRALGCKRILRCDVPPISSSGLNESFPVM